MESLEKQYKKLDQNEIGIEWHKAAKQGMHSKIKFMLDADYINITEDMIERAIFRASLNNDLKLFNLLLKQQPLAPECWTDALVTASEANGVKIVALALEKHQFTQEQISKAFNYSKTNTIKLLIPHVDLQKELNQNDFAFLKQIVRKGQIGVAQYLINNYNIDFTPFKSLAIENQTEHKGEEMLKMIETQELFNNLNESLDSKASKNTKHKI